MDIMPLSQVLPREGLCPSAPASAGPGCDLLCAKLFQAFAVGPFPTRPEHSGFRHA